MLYLYKLNPKMVYFRSNVLPILSTKGKITCFSVPCPFTISAIKALHNFSTLQLWPFLPHLLFAVTPSFIQAHQVDFFNACPCPFGLRCVLWVSNSPSLPFSLCVHEIPTVSFLIVSVSVLLQIHISVESYLFFICKEIAQHLLTLRIDIT